MHRNSHTFEIWRPAETVSRYLTDGEKLEQWIGGRVGARSSEMVEDLVAL